MAVLQTILNLLVASPPSQPELVVPAAPTTYTVHPLTSEQLDEVLRLNLRCFQNGENYTKHTFSYLLDEPRTIAYRAVTPENEMVGFVFVMVNENGAGHLTTIGVAPEHRRRGVGDKLLGHVDRALAAKEIATAVLEVRVGNTGAQEMYRRAGYSVVQRIGNYYNNGEDCFLMMKPIAAEPPK